MDASPPEACERLPVARRRLSIHLRALFALCAVLLTLGGSSRPAEARTQAKALGKKTSRAPDFNADGACTERSGAAIWVSPEAPVAGEPLRVLAVAESDASGSLASIGPDRKRVELPATRRGTSPSSLSAEIASPRAGRMNILWMRGDRMVACRSIEIVARAPRTGHVPGGKSVWESRRMWDRPLEDLYAAWIERLFDAPIDQSLDFRPLHQALRDPARNFLYGYLGLREDDPKKNQGRRPRDPRLRRSAVLPARLLRLEARAAGGVS